MREPVDLTMDDILAARDEGGGDPHLRGGLLPRHRRPVRAGRGRGAASTVQSLAAGKKITDHRGEQMLADYARLQITRYPVWPYHPRMWELCHSLGAYDAAYIALAEALGCELLTSDVKLKDAAGHHATVTVIG